MENNERADEFDHRVVALATLEMYITKEENHTEHKTNGSSVCLRFKPSIFRVKL